jgi:hypothetical protein
MVHAERRPPAIEQPNNWVPNAGIAVTTGPERQPRRASPASGPFPSSFGSLRRIPVSLPLIGTDRASPVRIFSKPPFDKWFAVRQRPEKRVASDAANGSLRGAVNLKNIRRPQL